MVLPSLSVGDGGNDVCQWAPCGTAVVGVSRLLALAAEAGSGMSLDSALDTLHRDRQIPLPQLLTEVQTVLAELCDALPQQAGLDVGLLTRCQVLQYLLAHVRLVPKKEP